MKIVFKITPLASLLLLLFLLLPASLVQSAEPSDAANLFASIQPLAERGDTNAQYNLALLYAKGNGVPQDYVEARKWHLKAAEQGNHLSQYMLGFFYAEGNGVAQDYTEARKWWLKSAKQGNHLSQHNLGLLYAEGNGVAQDYTEARKWWLKSAEQSNPVSQLNLGLLYAEGYGVPQNSAIAYAWLNIAADQGDQNAKDAQEHVAARLDAASLAEAQRLSREYFKRYVEPFR